MTLERCFACGCLTPITLSFATSDDEFNVVLPVCPAHVCQFAWGLGALTMYMKKNKDLDCLRTDEILNEAKTHLLAYMKSGRRG